MSHEAPKARPRWRAFPADAGYLPHMYLLNFAPPLYFLMREPAHKLTLGLAMIAVFVWLYRELHWLEASVKAQAMLTIQLAITLGFAIGYHPMYAYIGFMMSVPTSRQSVPTMIAIGGAFLIGLGFALVPYYGEAGLEFWMMLLPSVFGVCVLPSIIRASLKYHNMSERLQAASSQVERLAQQNERNRIARELHDTLGHTLSLIALKSELAEKLALRAPEQAARESREVRDTARAALKRMRELVSDMRTVKLAEEIGHARTLCAAAGIGLTVHASWAELAEAGGSAAVAAGGGWRDGGVLTASSSGRSAGDAPADARSGSFPAATGGRPAGDAPAEAQVGGVPAAKPGARANASAHAPGLGPVPYTPLQESILAMCLREALTNVVRHSRAGSCAISLEADEQSVRLNVSDDGIGLTGRQPGSGPAEGNGLRGIRERLALVEGTLTVSSNNGGSGRGTSLTIAIPLVRRQTDAGQPPVHSTTTTGGDSA